MTRAHVSGWGGVGLAIELDEFAGRMKSDEFVML